MNLKIEIPYAGPVLPGETFRAVQSVFRERVRQISAEGFNPAHDDEHFDGELAFAAAAYAQHVTGVVYASGLPTCWPWGRKWWKPKDRRSNLIRAAALLLAEIERLDRLEQRSLPPHEGSPL